MAEPVEWQPDGTPRSTRFDDVYRSSAGGLAQARHVFLAGCGLPQAWSGHAQWRILETGFGLGLNFLAAWRAWLDDAARPGLLHFGSVEAFPVSAADMVRSAQAWPELAPLADALAAQWFGLARGTHRLAFERGRVLLTLHIGEAHDALRGEPGVADSVFLDGFDPARNPQMWDEPLVRTVARHCRRGTRLATWTVAGDVRRALETAGFEVRKAEGLAPKRHCTQAVFDPSWSPRHLARTAAQAAADAIVIGAGLAGSAVAASLARRGWRVRVLDRASEPAAGASGLPVGLLAPHTSPDNNLLSRLSRAGVRMTLQAARDRLVHGVDWRASGALEHRVDDPRPLPAFDDAPLAFQREASPAQKSQARLAPDAPATWHEQAAWIKPAALVRALLDDPAIAWCASAEVRALERVGDEWVAQLASGEALRATLVVVAAALGSRTLVGDALRLNAVRGQIAWAMQDERAALPPFPLNGHGHFIPGVPHGDGLAWFCGSTYGRGDEDASLRREDVAANAERLARLAPAIASTLDAAGANAWAGVRCTSQDRRPLVGELAPGLWTSTAMGSRGLSFCVLAAELLAARLHDEPLPVARRLAAALDARR